jgi:transcriptional regulator with XRE-family HTH domain
MARPLIGRTVRRLRGERAMTQQALAARLGISASYLNLIEHDQRAVTAAVLFKLTEVLGVDLAALSGHAERQLEAGLREVLRDPLLGVETLPEEELRAMAAAAPNASRGVLALYRAWRVAREDASGIALPSGRRLLLPTEEARDFFHERANHFPELEAATEAMQADMEAAPAEMNHAIADGAAAPPPRRARAGRSPCRRPTAASTLRRASSGCPRRCRARGAASASPSSCCCWKRARRWTPP